MGRVCIVVSRKGRKYFATRFFADGNELTEIHPSEIIFSVTERVKSDADLKRLKEKARKEARQLGIHHVVNLDPERRLQKV